jgi:hypothetical protein
LVKETINRLVKEIETAAKEIREMDSLENETMRSMTLTTSLEKFMNFLDTVIIPSKDMPVQFFQLMEMICRDMSPDSRIPFLIWRFHELAVVSINKQMSRLLEPFVDTCTYLDEEPKCWFLLVPPSILEDPLSWTLACHEVAHILELTWIKAVEQVYGPLPDGISEDDPRLVEQNHGREYQADFVASYFIGPSFMVEIMLYYYNREMHLSASHPSWEERIKALKDLGLPQHPSVDTFRDLIREHLPQVKDHDKRISIPYTQVKVDEIIKETTKRINGRVTPFDCSTTQLRNAIDRLGAFLPYSEDYRCLLNAACFARRTALCTFESNRLGPVEKGPREFEYLIIDSIRLCYARQHYRQHSGPESTRKGAQKQSCEVIPV